MMVEIVSPADEMVQTEKMLPAAGGAERTPESQAASKQEPTSVEPKAEGPLGLEKEKGLDPYTFRLENDRVAIVPFDEAIHAPYYEEVAKQHPEMTYYVPPFPFPLKPGVPKPPLFAVVDKTVPIDQSNPLKSFAGITALIVDDSAVAGRDVGIVLFPSFHRTHVSTNVVGLWLLYNLDPPSRGGLGLRRVQWTCDVGNEGSKRAALRMGFEFEGVLRWKNRKGRVGSKAMGVEELDRRNGKEGGGDGNGIHSAVFSIVWDEWEEKRERVVELMARKT